jgi:hypothetical protein
MLTFRIIMVALLLVSVSAQAAVYSLTWVNPTQYTDGSPLLVSDIATIKIYCGVTPVLMASVPPVPAATTLELSSAQACYATATDINGKESNKSNSITLSVKPKPPTQLKRVPL